MVETFYFLMSIIDQPLINIIKNRRDGNLPVCSMVSTLSMFKGVLGCSNPKSNRVKVFLSTAPPPPETSGGHLEVN